MLRDLQSGAHRDARSVSKGLSRSSLSQNLRYSLWNAECFEDLFWHDLMLSDQVRMSTYARAIETLVPEGSVVVDVGTGSGVLACLAAKRARKVYAIEHSSLLDRARVLVDSNGLKNVELLRVHSRDFDPGEKVDVLLHEQIGMNLVDEDMIENLGDLRRRILRPEGRVLPARFELRVVPVSLAPDGRIPFLHEQKMYGLDFSAFREVNKPEIEAKGWDRRLIDPRLAQTLFAPPRTLTSIDLSTDVGGVLPAEAGASFVATTGGVLDGFVVYFSVEFSEDIWFHTGPGAPKTHWECRLYRTEQREIAVGDRLDFMLEITSPIEPGAWRWTYRVQR